MTSEPLRILLVDDHPLVRSGLRALLTSIPEMKVVGEASNGEEAIAQAAELQPDIILMDLNMPGINGIEATRRIVQTSPRIGILALTMLEDDASVFASMRAGARGYLLKGADQADVLRAISVVAHGEAIFSPSIAQRLMQYFANMQPILPQSAFPDLTEREREILGFIAQGKSNAEIAEELVLSSKTVSNHVSNIFSKLQVVDRAQAVLRARQAGLGQG
ncbi:DNA-binding response regulator [Ktedonobacter sp. SOSP1-52]|uniref:response regulator n=1 Tax=Ktedonobacter sp. SOSP1-52 TaxID=2778366 RepID=UPI0019165313|nr:response regulator transcription factor [Ktedonobacter sp. SOSP1-52]GHO72197.1 DNA-binding response regulator [Ktedonobacter sp. SOSP1-52]